LTWSWEETAAAGCKSVTNPRKGVVEGSPFTVTETAAYQAMHASPASTTVTVPAATVGRG
jgi:hypothetical protein